LLKCIYIGGRYCDGNPKLGGGPDYWVLHNTMRECSFIDMVDVIFYDMPLKAGYTDINDQILDSCRENKPDFIFYMYTYPSWGLNPEVLKLIRYRFHIPVIGCVGDTNSEFLKGLSKLVSSYCSLAFCLDGSDYSKEYLHVPTLYSACSKTYYDDGRERDIDVSFIGNISKFRGEFLNGISKEIPVFTSSGLRKTFLSQDEYADILRRSKITISFPRDIPDSFQRKGRPLEAMKCGAILAEEFNPVPHYYKAHEEYIVLNIHDPKESASIIKNHLEHPQLLDKIRKTNKEMVETVYTSDNFWKEITQKAGLYV